jgi:hypothetical protein
LRFFRFEVFTFVFALSQNAAHEKTSKRQKFLVPARQPKEPAKEGLLSYVLLESPFASISTVCRVTSLVSLERTAPGRQLKTGNDFHNPHTPQRGIELVKRQLSILLPAA